MYKILTKYTSTSNKIFWQSHMKETEDGFVEFGTEDMDRLRDEIKILDGKYGFENLRVINDVTYDINIDIYDDIENVEVANSEDVANIYEEAFNKIFTK